MAISVARLDESTRPGLERLLVQAWEANWGGDLGRALVRWRYDEKPRGGDTWLAFDGAQCVALLDTFVRPYLLDGAPLRVRETCDWFCLPRYRPLGVGISLMRRAMACPEPLFLSGGSAATLALVPRLRWTRIPEVQKWVLPLRLRSLVGTIIRMRWPGNEQRVRAIPEVVPLRRPARSPPPHGAAHVREWLPGNPPLLPRPQRPGLVQLLSTEDLAWFAAMPRDFAQPLGLAFLLDGETVGFSLSQLEPAASGYDACIVHLQLARDDQQLADWVVSETVAQLAGRGAGIVRCCASSEMKVAALRKAGFFARKPHPGHWWSKQGISPPAVIDTGYLRADDSLPFPALRERYLGARGESLLAAPA
ncbi:hypothetical protein E0493_06960 [Roseomonas sp. M0104]|uniref:Uncharacterized protein n=1 Tax=Teichococcus coralli TaxID=2545983 RepID=A0A845B641_9PROT|nr:hypothetical protein [Pseudoroseomonas coralli]MXP63093.1 hypothetical protein [Pseudoroseomonas coralli]